MSYDQELKNEWDNNSALSYAKEKGVEEGREEGREEGIKEGERRKAISTARELKKMGISLNQIAAAIELSVEEIAAL